MFLLLTKLILVLFGLLVINDFGFYVPIVSAYLFAITASALSGYYQIRLLTRITGVAYLLATFFFPNLLVFLPLFAMDFMGEKEYLLLGISLLALIGAFVTFDIRQLVMILLLCFFGLLIRYLYEKLTKTKRKLLISIDDREELKTTLQSKNQTLQKSYHTDIHLATLKERNRIAREIHDNVGHILTRSIFQIGAVEVINQEENLKTPLANLHETLDLAMTSIRSSVHDLRDDSIDFYQEIQKILSTNKTKIDLSYEVGEKIPIEVIYCFLTILKEAMTNIAKHSDATLVRVLVREYPGLYQFIIYDNGSKKPSLTTKGIGMRSMEERVASLTGNFNVSYQNGVRIFISISKKVEESK